MFIDGLRNQIPQSEHESREKVPQVTLNPGSSYCEECLLHIMVLHFCFKTNFLCQQTKTNERSSPVIKADLKN